MNLVDFVFLIIVANGAPILATYAFQDRLSWPIDGGSKLSDGQRFLGESKTLRGIVAAVGLTTIMAIMIGHAAICGILISAYAMCGDLITSFVKRRLRLRASTRAPLLDQLPEALLPALVIAPDVGLGTWDVAAVAVAFLLTAVILSPILYRAGIRKQWY